MAKRFPLRIIFVIGVLILLASILFRVQHWPGVINIFWAGFACHILFFLLLFIEMLGSKKASSNAKVFWGFPYAAVLLSSLFIFPEYSAIAFVLLGAIYLFFGRRQFV